MTWNEFTDKTDDELRKMIVDIEYEIGYEEQNPENWEWVESGWDIAMDEPRYEEQMMVSAEYFISDLKERVLTIKKELKRRKTLTVN